MLYIHKKTTLKTNIVRVFLLVFILFFIRDFTVLINVPNNRIIYFLVGAFCMILSCLMLQNNTRCSVNQILVILLILNINTSFTSIAGISYSVLPISWFTIISVFLFINNLRNIDAKFMLILLLFVLFYLLSFIINDFLFLDGTKQFVNIVLFMILACIVTKTSVFNNVLDMHTFTFFYILETIGFCLLVIIQQILFSKYLIETGTLAIMSGRVSYGATFSDFSFSSLYIATGLMISIYYLFIESDVFRIFKFVVIITIQFISLIIVNARTGLLSIAIGTVFMMVKLSIKRNKRAYFCLGFVIAGFTILFLLMQNFRGGQSWFDGSGRLSTYITGLDVFRQHPLIGIGFGIKEYRYISGNIIPHNFFIQYLAQFGIIGITIILSVFVLLVNHIQGDRFQVFCAFFVTIIGCLLIPDILSSHFLTVVIFIMCCLDEKQKE